MNPEELFLRRLLEKEQQLEANRLTRQSSRQTALVMKQDTFTPHTSSLDALQSKEQLTLLDEIDKLRAFGVSDFVALPQLVVCGDQSAGKSSVLEAITEIPFPRNDNLCTRFATEIILRRAAEESVKVTIKPDQSRIAEEQNRLLEFDESLENFEDLPKVIEKATNEMAGVDSGEESKFGAFFMDVLCVEVAGPNKPQLSLVDLPGLIHSENKQQTKADVELVKKLVDLYLEQPRTIILAVVAATNDYACQIILERARKFDPTGSRTLGIITKPDTLPSGSDKEAAFISLAMNQDIKFELGWHVLKNRGYEHRNATFQERNILEASFFSKGSWIGFPKSSVGIHSLRTKLSNLLHRHIKNELPNVRKEITEGISATKAKLAELGQKRVTVEEQRLFLSEISQEFQKITSAAVQGQYVAQYFALDASKGSEKVPQKRLKAVIRSKNENFAKVMGANGSLRSITDEHVAENCILEEESDNDDDDDPTATPPETQIKATMREALLWVKHLMVRSRGDELPGTFNPLLIANLFWEQSSPWKNIAKFHLEDVWATCYKFVIETLGSITKDEIKENLIKHHIGPIMETRLQDAQEELQAILDDEKRNPVTYDDYFSETFQRFRNKRNLAICQKKLDKLMKNQSNGDGSPSQIDMKLVVQGLANDVERDQQKFACTELLYAMLSYYKVAYKRFIDNVAMQVIDRHLVHNLPEIFSATTVIKMHPEVLDTICAESQESQETREKLELKLKSLEAGLRVCMGLHTSKVTHRFSSSK